jgi:hypothetical protein
MKKLLLACVLLAAAVPAFAQTVTLTPSVTSGNGSIATTLTWSTTPAATSCTASGHASWTGAKAASGSLALPVITMSGTYTLTLDCSWPGDAQAIVSWTRPTTNTDGSALAQCAVPVPTSGACLAGFRVYKATSPTLPLQSPEMTPVNTPSALSYTWTGINPAGTYYFAVEAVNANGVPSDVSNVASKVITSTTTRNASATVTVNPKPGKATITSVE